jgi:hypothetical protein
MEAVMRHRFLKFLILIVLVPVILLTACDLKLPFTSPSPAGTPDVSPSAAPPETPSPAATDWHSGVQTNYSGLTPYQPPEELYTRLSDGPMTELKPSGDYGKLLPYVGASLFGDMGYLSFNMLGLVTDNGMIITDPVFSRVYQGSFYNYADYTSTYVPAYALVKLNEPIDEDNLWDSERCAVCALDGSWITSFDYTSVYFGDKVILGMRSNDQNDVDVFDYDGELLFNTTSLGCYDLVPPQSGYAFMNGYGEGLLAVQLTNGKTVYIDALTGAERYTDYQQAEAFFGGFARVTVNSLVGFIDRSFSLVIQPQYYYADYFSDGRSVVQLQDHSYAVIDTNGGVLFQRDTPISRWDKSFFCVYDNDYNETLYYDSRFNEIKSGSGQLISLSDGWFYYTDDGGVVIMNGREKYTIDGIATVSGVAGGLVYYYVNETDSWSEGVKTLDGEDVVPLSKNTSVYLVTSKTSGDVFISVSSYSQNGTNQTFKVLDRDGNTILSGQGYATYDGQRDLFEVYGEQFFGYADTSGQYIFKISLLQYLPD